MFLCRSRLVGKLSHDTFDVPNVYKSNISLTLHTKEMFIFIFIFLHPTNKQRGKKKLQTTDKKT